MRSGSKDGGLTNARSGGAPITFVVVAAWHVLNRGIDAHSGHNRRDECRSSSSLLLEVTGGKPWSLVGLGATPIAARVWLTDVVSLWYL
jgi:hypothetical protein